MWPPGPRVLQGPGSPLAGFRMRVLLFLGCQADLGHLVGPAGGHNHHPPEGGCGCDSPPLQPVRTEGCHQGRSNAWRI
jgi:hypothetical protein